MAVRVYRELVESATAVRQTPIGIAMTACLVTQGDADVEAASTIVQFVAALRAELFRRLQIASGGSSSAADAGSSTLATVVAHEIAPDALPLLRPDESLQANVATQLGAWVGHPLSLGQHVALNHALVGALSMLLSLDERDRGVQSFQPREHPPTPPTQSPRFAPTQPTPALSGRLRTRYAEECTVILASQQRRRLFTVVSKYGRCKE